MIQYDSKKIREYKKEVVIQHIKSTYLKNRFDISKMKLYFFNLLKSLGVLYLFIFIFK
jgi:hypothetical protein